MLTREWLLDEQCTVNMKKGILCILAFSFYLCAVAQTIATASMTFHNCATSESHTVDTIGCGAYRWNGVNYTESTETSLLLSSFRGCDSTAYLHLVVENWSTEETLPPIELCAADLPYIWEGNKPDQNNIIDFACNKVGTYTRIFTNVRGCDSVVNLTLLKKEEGCRPVGALNGLFTINASGTKVYFSRGNLQYCAAPATGETTHNVLGGGTKSGVFRFAPNQFDWVGNATVGNVYENGAKCSNTLASETYSGWIDLFGFGTSGYNNKYPYMTTSAQNYIQNNLTGNYANYDWGVYNAIGNGGNEPGLWRTLSRTEWQYLMETRPNAAKKYGLASVNGVQGLIILPDVWLQPEGISAFVPYKYETAAYTNNVFYTEKHSLYVAGITNSWNLMEEAGAVFLPAGGYRGPSNSDASNTNGYYYSTTWGGSSRYAYYMSFYYQNSHYYIRPSDGGINQQDYGSTGLCVRLVQEFIDYNE